jgi:phenylacetate-CoA ligase
MGRIRESIILNGILPLADLKYHTHMPSWYRRIQKMLKWSPEEIKRWQTEGMQNLVRNAYEHSKYYRELFDFLHIKPMDFLSIEDLERIPPLTKDIIRERYDDILLDNRSQFYWKTTSTGGSTGNPTKYVKDNNSWGFDNAYNLLMWQRTGYHYGDKFLALGSASIFPTNKNSKSHDLYYILKRKMPFNAMNLSSERLAECAKYVIDNNIHYIYGYASSIFLFAKYIIENSLQDKLSIRACFPTSEILTDVYRETIYNAFKCPIDDSYGANDGGIVAHKLDDEKGYKVGYNCIVQIKEPLNGKENYGTALMTDVTNTVFPFIRYELGDILELGDGYNEFHNGQVLNKVVGRTSDIISLENGRNLTGPGFTILFKDLNVKGYRIFKSNPMEITIELVKLPEYTDTEERLIIDTLHKHAGSDVKVLINYKSEIVTRKNGKNLFFLNEQLKY